MDPLVSRPLWSVAGATCSFLFGMWRGRLRNDGYFRKAVVEIAGGTLAGSIVASLVAIPIESLSLQSIVSFLAGAAFSQTILWARDALTRRIERLSPRLLHWLKSQNASAARINDPPRLAFPRPALFWLRVLHPLGLTNLRHEHILACEIYRAEVARQVMPEGWTVFPVWCKHRVRPVVAVSVLGALTQLAALYAFPHLAYLSQACFILILFYWVPDPLTSAQKPGDNEAVRRLWRNWCLIWGSWSILYFVLFVQGIGLGPSGTGAHIPFWTVAMNVLNNINTLLFVGCYFLLSAIVVEPDPFPEDESSTGARLRQVYVIGFVALLIFTTAEILQDQYRWPLPVEAYGWISGFAGGVALAMLVGRLQSPYISPPTWAITILYGYAAIQGAMGAFEDKPSLRTVLLVPAFLCKCVLFLLFAWILETGLVLHHVEEHRESVKDRPSKLKSLYGESDG